MKLKEKNVLEWMFDTKEGQLTLERAIFTTFTLMSSVLYDLLLYAISPNLMKDETSDSQKRLQLAKNGIEAAKKLTVFSDDYVFTDPHIPRSLNQLLESYFIPHMVCRISLKEGGFFHPKLMITHFKDGNKNDHFRFAVLSKNLTHAKNVIEICTLFETTDKPVNPKLTVEGREIADFITSFQGKDSLRGASLSQEDAKDRIAGTLDVLSNSTLRLVLPDQGQTPEKVELVFGKPGCRVMRDKLEQDINATPGESFYLCSDSIDPGLLGVDPFNKCRFMISNLRSWAKHNKIGDHSCYFRQDNSPRTVHAKFAEFYTGEQHIVWSGSANFTNNALDNNYECDVRIEYEDAECKEFHFEQVNGFDKVDPTPFFQASKDTVRKVKYEDAKCQEFHFEQVIYFYKVDPTPFSQAAQGTVRKVKATECEEERKVNELANAVKALEWKCSIVDGKLVIETRRPLACKYLDLKSVGIHIKSVEIYLNRRIPLVRWQDFYFYTKIERFSEDMIPWYGKAIIIVFTDLKDDGRYLTLEIPVDVDISVVKTVQQPLLDEKNSAHVKRLEKGLLLGCMPRLIDVIPVTVDTAKYYDESDTFEARLAKYRASATASDEELLTYAEKLIESLEDNNIDGFENDGEYSYYKETTEKLKERLKAFLAFLGGEQNA